MLFYLLLLAIILVFFKLGKDILKSLERFSETSPTKRAIWTGIKSVFLIGASSLLLFGTFRRWYSFHDEMIYSKDKNHLNMSYADKLEVQTYLMSHQNILDLFEGKSPNPDTQSIQDLGRPIFHNEMQPTDPRFYLVIALKNKGDQACWGVLENYANGRKCHLIDVPPIPGKMKEFKFIIIQANSSEQNIPGDYPTLEAKWLKLYSSKEEDL